MTQSKQSEAHPPVLVVELDRDGQVVDATSNVNGVRLVLLGPNQGCAVNFVGFETTARSVHVDPIDADELACVLRMHADIERDCRYLLAITGGQEQAPVVQVDVVARIPVERMPDAEAVPSLISSAIKAHDEILESAAMSCRVAPADVKRPPAYPIVSWERADGAIALHATLYVRAPDQQCARRHAAAGLRTVLCS